MIIWRGWGVATLLAVLGIPVGFGLWSVLGLGDAVLPAFVGAGLALGAVGTFFLGRWLNEIRPQTRVTGWAQRRRAELDHHVAAGTFHLGSGYAAPRSAAEARQQADALFEAELGQVRSGGRNAHTFFFVPMQYFSVLLGVVGLGLVVYGAVSGAVA